MKSLMKRIFAGLIAAIMFASLAFSFGAINASAISLNDPAQFYQGNANYALPSSAGANVDLVKVVTNIINWVMGLLGLVAVVVIIWAGFLWMTAGGNEDQLKKAKDKVIQGVIGLVMIMAAWSIAYFVISTVGSKFINAS